MAAAPLLAEAERVQVGGTGVGVGVGVGVGITVIVTLQLVEPCGPVAVPVYVVVTVGNTLAVPAAAEATAPTPLSITNAVAPEIAHERVEEEPSCTVVFDAARAQAQADASVADACTGASTPVVASTNTKANTILKMVKAPKELEVV